MAPKNSLLNASVYLRSHASIAERHVNVGMMTSGGLAPCLSSSVAQLAKFWIEALKEKKIAGLTLRMYVDGYAGILTGHSFVVPESEWKDMEKLKENEKSKSSKSKYSRSRSVSKSQRKTPSQMMQLNEALFGPRS